MPMLPRGEALANLNRRYKDGKPTNDLALAGLLVHQFGGRDTPILLLLNYCTTNAILDVAERVDALIVPFPA